jgi:hypothetical protein
MSHLNVTLTFNRILNIRAIPDSDEWRVQHECCHSSIYAECYFHDDETFISREIEFLIELR